VNILGRIICVGGWTGAGKDFTCKGITKRRPSFVHVCPTLKTIAEEEGFSDVAEFQKVVSAVMDGTDKTPEHQKYKDTDKLFDEKLYDEVKSTLDQGRDVVVSTWLGPWILEKISKEKGDGLKVDFKVWLYAPAVPCAERMIRGRSDAKSDIEETIRYMKEKDQNNIGRYMDVYGIDITDHSNFDIEINSISYNGDKLVDLVLSAFDIKFGGRC